VVKILHSSNVRGFVHYKSRKRDVNREGSTRLTYTGFHGELEHLKIQTRFMGGYRKTSLLWNYKQRPKEKTYIRCRCYERHRTKVRGNTSLSHTRWNYQIHLNTSISLVYPHVWLCCVDRYVYFHLWVRSVGTERKRVRTCHQIHWDTSISPVES
jgi:hypothetical protein